MRYANPSRQHSGFSLLICSPEPGEVMATNHVEELLKQEAIRNLKSSIVSLSSMKTRGDDQLPFMHGEIFFSRVHRASIKLISQSIESRSCSSLINTSK